MPFPGNDGDPVTGVSVIGNGADKRVGGEYTKDL